jgi:hypothetical protein
MSLIITFMLEPAKLQMNWARASGNSNCLAALRDRVGSLPLVIARPLPAAGRAAATSLAAVVPGCLIPGD